MGIIRSRFAATFLSHRSCHFCSLFGNVLKILISHFVLVFQALDCAFFSFFPLFLCIVVIFICFFLILDWQKTEADKQREKILLDELVDIVNKRDELVQDLHHQEQA